MKKRALISVSDKRGIENLAEKLSNQGFEIISTGGTAKYLKEKAIDVIMAEQVTGFPECFDGRIKTLHPNIHGAILHDRSNAAHMKRAEELDIKGIDIVVVNLYPFEKVYNDPSSSYEDKIENIDIGGPAMVRASAKNYKNVIILTDPDDYDEFAKMLEKDNGDLHGTHIKYRKRLAAKAFSLTNEYDNMIAGFLLESEEKIEDSNNKELPVSMSINIEKFQELRYGENPHQAAGIYLEKGKNSPIEKLGGKELSYNNYLDIDAAVDIVKDFKSCACVAVKHGTPCGVAVGENGQKAYLAAYSCDTESIFGGVVAFNVAVDASCAKELTKTFLEIVVAPDFTSEALEELRKKKNLRIIKTCLASIEAIEIKDKWPLEIRGALGSYLVQQSDDKIETQEELSLVTSHKASPQEMEDILNGLIVCKHIRSNGIVIFKEGKMIGIGAGYTSRVRALKAACENSLFPVDGGVMVSDGFFPFPDSIEYAASKGIMAVVHPGGSLKDDSVTESAEKLGISLFVTGTRHFKH